MNKLLIFFTDFFYVDNFLYLKKMPQGFMISNNPVSGRVPDPDHSLGLLLICNSGYDLPR